MATITKEIRVDVARRNNFAIVAKQNDRASRFLKVTLCNEAYPIKIDESATVILNAERKDGSSAAFAGEVNPDGTVTVPLTSWILALEDETRCSVSILDADGQRRLTSTAFAVHVEAAEVSNDDITEDENYDILLRLIEDCRSAAEEARRAAEGYESAGGELEGRVGALEDAFADHLYEPIRLLSPKITPSVAEKGLTVNSVRLDWSLNHDAEHQTVEAASRNGQIRLDGAARSYTFEERLTEGDTFTILAYEKSPSGKTYADGAELRLNFYNGVYSGVGGASTELSALTKSLQSGRGKTFSGTAGVGQYFWYACPESYGTPKFTVGGFDGGFELQSSNDYRNVYGYVEKYRVWRSVNDNLGSVTVVVS